MLEKVTKLLLDKAPKIATAFLEPATAEEIDLLRNNVAGALPQSLIELYKSSKGQDPEKVANFAYGVTWITILQTAEFVESYTAAGDGNELRYADKGIDKSYTLGRKRFPIAGDCSSCLICVDLDPTEDGSYGQVVLIDYDYQVALKLATSIAEFISNFEKDLVAMPHTPDFAVDEDAIRFGVKSFSYLIQQRVNTVE